jgi:hypothetical protein
MFQVTTATSTSTTAPGSGLDALKVPTLPTPAEIREGYQLRLSVPPARAGETIRADLKVAAEQEPPRSEQLIEVLKEIPSIAYLYSQDARIMERYSIEEHTAMVLRQLDRYLANPLIPLPLPLSTIRLAGAVHDIGKPLPDQKSDQHASTLQVIDSIRTILPWIPVEERAITRSLIQNDPIGKLVVSSLAKQATIEERRAIAAVAAERQLTFTELATFASLVSVKAPGEVTEQIEAAATNIHERANMLGVDPLQLFNLHVLFYQADTSAYTYDAVAPSGRRASPGLDFIYQLQPAGAGLQFLVRDESRGLIRFSPAVEKLIQTLEEEISRRRTQ